MQRFFLAIGMLSLVVSSRLHSQTPGDLIANIPFSFQIGPTRMPAGTYVVHQNDTVLTVRQTGLGGRSFTIITQPAYRDDKPRTGELDFNRYGDTYFLAEVWSPQSSSGLELPRGAAEKELISRVRSFQKTGVPLKTQ